MTDFRIGKTESVNNTYSLGTNKFDALSKNADNVKISGRFETRSEIDILNDDQELVNPGNPDKKQNVSAKSDEAYEKTYNNEIKKGTPERIARAKAERARTVQEHKENGGKPRLQVEPEES